MKQRDIVLPLNKESPASVFFKARGQSKTVEDKWNNISDVFSRTLQDLEFTSSRRLAKKRLRQETSLRVKGKLIDAQVVVRALKRANAKIFWFGSNIQTLKFLKSLQC